MGTLSPWNKMLSQCRFIHEKLTKPLAGNRGYHRLAIRRHVPAHEQLD